jgi:rod shape-determining protein MreC
VPLGTLDRTPPPFFRQGPSAVSRLAILGALAIFLMTADTRFHIATPIRVAVATVLAPLQWLAQQPVQAGRGLGQYLSSLQSAEAKAAAAERKLGDLSQRAVQVEQLSLENARLRKLLDMRERLGATARPAQVLYDAADPYTRKVIIDAGLTQSIMLGSAVMDETGVLGQVTRVYPQVSEVTLLSDRDQSTPVLNTRTGARGVAFGDGAGGMELRFVAANADVREGDLLTTSGVDGVFTAGLPVARITRIDRRVDSAFARVQCAPAALVSGAVHVVVLAPVSAQIPQRPADNAVAEPGKKTGRKPAGAAP